MAVNNGVEEISEKQFNQKISKNLVLVDFFAEWCMPCVMMAPVIEELSEKFKGKIEFVKMNVDENRNLSSKLKIMSIPTLIVFKKGKESSRDVSLSDLAEAKRKLGLSQQEVRNLLIMRSGVNVKSPHIEPAEGSLGWDYYLRTMQRNQPDLFRDDSNKRERL